MCRRRVYGGSVRINGDGFNFAGLVRGVMEVGEKNFAGFALIVWVR